MIKKLFRFHSNVGFRTRSTARDTDKDNEAIGSIAKAIEAALRNADVERMGLKARIDAILSHAAIVGGNDADDYQTRTEDRAAMLRSCDYEIERGEERLKVLDQNIQHFRFLKSALQSRFPGLNI